MARGHARVLVLGQARNCSLLVRLRRCVTCSARGQGFQPFDASEEGAWEELPGGGAAWRLTVRSPGALSHVLVFRCARLSCSHARVVQYRAIRVGLRATAPLVASFFCGSNAPGGSRVWSHHLSRPACMRQPSTLCRLCTKQIEPTAMIRLCHMPPPRRTRTLACAAAGRAAARVSSACRTEAGQDANAPCAAATCGCRRAAG